MEKTFLFFFGGPSFVKKGSKEKAGVESPVPTTHTHTLKTLQKMFLSISLENFPQKPVLLELIFGIILSQTYELFYFNKSFFRVRFSCMTLMTYPDSFLRAEQEKQQKKTARCWEFLLKCHAVKPCKGSISDNQQT